MKEGAETQLHESKNAAMSAVSTKAQPVSSMGLLNMPESHHA
jgi:hypothetical protein